MADEWKPGTSLLNGSCWPISAVPPAPTFPRDVRLAPFNVVQLRAFYDFGVADCARMTEHLAGLPNVTVEDWPAVLEAARLHRAGLDFADALHLARSGRCEAFMTFDDRKFARRANKLAHSLPPVRVP